METCKPTNLTINNYPNILEIYYRLDAEKYLLLDRTILRETPWISEPIDNIDLNGVFSDEIETMTPDTYKSWFQYYLYLGSKYSSLDQLILTHPEALI